MCSQPLGHQGPSMLDCTNCTNILANRNGLEKYNNIVHDVCLCVNKNGIINTTTKLLVYIISRNFLFLILSYRSCFFFSIHLKAQFFCQFCWKFVAISITEILYIEFCNLFLIYDWFIIMFLSTMVYQFDKYFTHTYTYITIIVLIAAQIIKYLLNYKCYFS